MSGRSRSARDTVTTDTPSSSAMSLSRVTITPVYTNLYAARLPREFESKRFIRKHPSRAGEFCQEWVIGRERRRPVYLAGIRRRFFLKTAEFDWHCRLPQT